MRRAAYASAAILVFASFASSLPACARKPLPPPPREPPARVLSVALERIALQASAYTELHAWLAAAGRDAVPPPAGLEAAADVYRAALANDDRDELLRTTTAALARCSDDACALAALERTPFRRAYSGSIATFVNRWWTERATVARAGIEIARATLSVETEGVLAKAATDLGITWPEGRVVVDVVVDAPPAGREALIGVALPVHGPCFVRGDAEQLQNARIHDCVLVRALLPLREKSKNGSVLDARAWELLVIHAVAATIASLEPQHASPSWRSAYAVEPRALDWLKKNYRPDDATFMARWKDEWPKLARDFSANH